LYAGAVVATLGGRRETESPVAWRHARRIAAAALIGATLAPAALAWGLQRSSAAAGALLLNLEAAFTVLLARMLLRETLSRTAATAVLVMFAGGALIMVDQGRQLTVSGVLPSAAVTAAVVLWALDSVLTRPLAELDPAAVVRGKAALGATLSAAIALATGERLGGATDLLVLAAAGAAGYGLSLRAYLLAQRAIGAGRTASVFSAGPVLGAIAAAVFADVAPGPLGWGGGLLLVLGVVLHAAEHHEHEHEHDAVEHEHPHGHDDGHHDHVHDPPVSGVHSHSHRHERVVHRHAHAPDVHHRHRHG
jgi:drug/metabolite transporter (DMT)-like permease